LQIAEDLRSRIASGSLADGAKMPSQRDLAAEFSTTLMTVRQALEILEDEELVRTEHGRGMFVSAPRISEFDREKLFGFDTEMGMRHQRIATRLLDGAPAMIYPQAARLLGFGARSAPPSIRRLRILDGMPIVLQASFLAPRFASLLATYDPTRSLYEQLTEACGSPVAMTKEILLPIVLDGETAVFLERNPGDAAMLSARMSRSSEGEALVYDEAIMAGDSFFISAERIGKRHSYDLNFGKGGVLPVIEQLLKED
jgi:GntR family transcriptional regulator